MNPIVAFVWFLLIREIPGLIWTLDKEAVKPIDPSKINYCDYPCHNPEDPSHPYEHVACNCDEIKWPYMEMERHIYLFRKLMLNMHNEGRNRIANGLEPECQGCPKASNMMLLNCDLEMEHIAKCHVQRRSMWDVHDKYNFCRRKAKHPFNPGKSINYQKKPALIEKNKIEEYLIEAIRAWYFEFKYFPNISEIIRRFEGGVSAGLRYNNLTFTHFTQFVWGPLTHLGCAMGWIPEHSAENELSYGYYLECSYANWRGGPNIFNQSVYSPGEPCTKCPFGTKCEKNPGLEALCGHMEPVPGREPPPSKPTNYRESPNINQFPLMYGERKEKGRTSLADELKPKSSTPSNNIKNSLIPLMVIIMIWMDFLD